MLAVSLFHSSFVNRRVKLANEATFKRMKDTMEKLRDTPMEKLSSLSQILLGQARPAHVDDLPHVKFIDETLNDSQKEAVLFCLTVPDIALIHGPPGVTSPPPGPQKSQASLISPDWKNLHSHRNHPTTHLTATTPIPPRRRPIKHLGR